MRNEVNVKSASGVYVLFLFLQKDNTLRIGKLGKHNFPKGHYTYTGSALGTGASSLKHRVARHLRKEKRKFWHIDYLLACKKTSVEAVVAAGTDEKLECALNSHLKGIEDAEVPVQGFGASDCRDSCGSHLLFFPEMCDIECLVMEAVGYLRSLVDVSSVEVIR